MQQDLTEKFIQKLKQSPPEAGYILIYDTAKVATSGFGLRFTAGGVASFFIEYRYKGRRKRFTIGQHPDWSLMAARNEATDKRSQINKGQDPAEIRARERREPTMNDLGRDYLERHARPTKSSSSQRNDVQMLNGIILPPLGKFSRECCVPARY